MNRTVKLLLSILLVIIIAVLTGTMVFVIKYGFNPDYSASSMELADSYKAEVDATDKIFLDLYSADVEINESTDSTITVEFYSNTDADVTIGNNGKTLTVEEIEKNNQSFRFNERKKVVINVPAAYMGEYEIKTESGDVRAKNNLLNNTVSISTESGDVSLKETGGVNVSTESGDVRVNQISKTAAITTESGDVYISTMEIDADSNITTSSGDVIVRDNRSNCYVETDTSSGDVAVNKSDRKSDIVLTIKTSSGDIIVD